MFIGNFCGNYRHNYTLGVALDKILIQECRKLRSRKTFAKATVRVAEQLERSRFGLVWLRLEPICDPNATSIRVPGRDNRRVQDVTKHDPDYFMTLTQLLTSQLPHRISKQLMHADLQGHCPFFAVNAIAISRPIIATQIPNDATIRATLGTLITL